MRYPSDVHKKSELQALTDFEFYELSALKIMEQKQKYS